MPKPDCSDQSRTISVSLRISTKWYFVILNRPERLEPLKDTCPTWPPFSGPCRRPEPVACRRCRSVVPHSRRSCPGQRENDMAAAADRPEVRLVAHCRRCHGWLLSPRSVAEASARPARSTNAPNEPGQSTRRTARDRGRGPRVGQEPQTYVPSHRRHLTMRDTAIHYCESRIPRTATAGALDRSP